MKGAIAKLGPLKRKNNLSINTIEGWNDYLRVENSKDLIERGIEPTEENLKKYQLEVNTLADELKKKYPPGILPIERTKFNIYKGGKTIEA